MELEKLDRKSQSWKGFKFGVAGLQSDLPLTCGDSDLEIFCTRPCLAISEYAQKRAPTMSGYVALIIKSNLLSLIPVFGDSVMSSYLGKMFSD